MTVPTAPATPAATLRSLLKGGSLHQGLQEVERRIRRQPDVLEHRLLCFDLLCLLGEWKRAIGQLQICARLDPERTPEAHLYKGLVQSELFRADVFAAKRRPVLPAEGCTWLDMQLRALALYAEGNLEASDTVREQALEQAEELSGQITDGREHTEKNTFQWITDSDSRLGPALELFVAGQYRWMPFSAVTRLRIAVPQTPRDLVWLPVRVEVHPGPEADGTMLAGFLPVRYPGSEFEADSIRLSRETRWKTIGRTAVTGLGQKMWSTDKGDFAACDVRELNSGDGGQA